MKNTIKNMILAGALFAAPAAFAGGAGYTMTHTAPTVQMPMVDMVDTMDYTSMAMGYPGYNTSFEVTVTPSIITLTEAEMMMMLDMGMNTNMMTQGEGINLANTNYSYDYYFQNGSNGNMTTRGTMETATVFQTNAPQAADYDTFEAYIDAVTAYQTARRLAVQRVVATSIEPTKYQ